VIGSSWRGGDRGGANHGSLPCVVCQLAPVRTDGGNPVADLVLNFVHICSGSSADADI
jgi:hypothetical protein